MKLRCLIFILLVSGCLFGKTTYISTDKLPVSKENDMHLQFIRSNEKYVVQGAPQGEIGIGKVALVEGLKSALHFYSIQDATNLEINLLLGDVSAYLSYLDEPTYFDVAINYYKKAIRLAPIDYRAFWFLGMLYHSSNDLVKAVDYFKLAQSRLPKVEPVEFWEQSARLANQANMPSTCIYAMDKAKSLLNRPCDFDRSYGASVRNKIVEMNNSRTYANKELWSYTEDSKINFTSRALGIQVNIDPEWALDISGFEQKKATFTIIPPAVTCANGQEHTFSISIVSKVVSEEDDLKTYMNSLIIGKLEKNEIEFSDKYPGILSYELKDSVLHKDQGGSHQYLIGIKRKKPLYPGLAFEQPFTHSNIGELENGWPVNYKNRFQGSIFYVVKLDASEDVFQSAKHTFWDVFNNHIFLE